MKNMGIGIVLMAVVLLVGCESQELVTCREDNQILQGQVVSLQKELSQSRSNLEKQKEENAAIQTKAMESIMGMLQKEEQRRKELQASLEKEERQRQELQTSLSKTAEQLKAEAQKKAAAEQAAAQLREQIKALQADLAKQQARIAAPE